MPHVSRYFSRLFCLIAATLLSACSTAPVATTPVQPTAVAGIKKPLKIGLALGGDAAALPALRAKLESFR